MNVGKKSRKKIVDLGRNKKSQENTSHKKNYSFSLLWLEINIIMFTSTVLITRQNEAVARKLRFNP